jgi:hypothetical protein
MTRASEWTPLTMSFASARPLGATAPIASGFCTQLRKNCLSCAGWACDASLLSMLFLDISAPEF